LRGLVNLTQDIEDNMAIEATPHVLTEVLKQLYEELRSYRDKEFRTFLFAFPIIAASLLYENTVIATLHFPKDTELFLKGFVIVIIKLIFLTFGYSMIKYIQNNHRRMMVIKKEIVHLQEDLGINQAFKYLNPEEWSQRSGEGHLGRDLYVNLLYVSLVILLADLVHDLLTLGL